MTCAACGGRVAETDRFCANCGAVLRAPAPPQEARRKVSILFLDLVGSTQLAERLDPEPLRAIMDDYYAMSAACVTEHGGVVEKFIGDAIMAAFGATVAHEDDAVRAVRAAAAALAALRELSARFTDRYNVTLEARCGVCTGDVVVLTMPGGDFRLTGDAVNTASRLQTAAPTAGILVDADTAAIVRSRVAVEPVTPLRLKGKANPVAAYRVVDAESDGDEPDATPFVGRTDELLELRQSFRRVVRGRQMRLVTVLGVPGIGKSRLVQEFVGTVAADQAWVLSGRCFAYGKGITYKPLAEMLASFPGGWPALADRLGTGSLVARTLATVMGDETGTVGTVDIAWAVRSLLDALGGDRPVIMVWEDLHWSEETLLDLVDDVVTRLTDVPVLMVCVARGELLEARPTWGGGKPSAMTVELGPMTDEESAELVAHLAVREDVYAHALSDTRDRVAAQCDGNPLFAELLMHVVDPDTEADVRTPPTIHALLGARLDRLPARERTVVELAAIIGRDFTVEVLRAVAQADGIAEAAVTELIATLVRRRILVRGPARTIRFAQALLRETAYEFTPKTHRQRRHDFVARWYAAQGDALAVAYHVEAAWRLRTELRPGDPELPELASEVVDTLTAEGMRALNRKDLPSAVQLLERARALLAPGDARHTALALHVCDAALWLWDVDRCLAALAAAEAALPGDRHNQAVCAIQREIVSLRLGLVSPEHVAANVATLTAALDRDPGDDPSWCRFHYLTACLHLVEERTAAAEAALRLALARARAMADGYEEDWLLCAVCELAQWAPTPVDVGLALCRTLAVRFATNRAPLLPVLVTWANLLVLAGDFAGAEGKLATLAEHLDEIHLDLPAAAALEITGQLAALSGRHDQAEDSYRRALDLLRTREQAPDTENIEVLIARAIFAQGRPAEAARCLDRIEAGVVRSPRARIAATALRGRIESARGEHEPAVATATAARALSDGSDDLRLAGETEFDLAVVLHAAGRDRDAAVAAAAALRAFEAKGASVLADQVRAWLSVEAVGDPEVPGG